MNRAYSQYQNNSKSIKELGQLFNLIVENFPLLQTQAEEILRAQFVMIVSALDTYIHDVVRTGMLEIYQSNRTGSKQTDMFSIDFDTLKQIESTTDIQTKLALLEQSIQNKNAKESYQSPKSIEYALNLINIDKLWVSISTDMQKKAEDIRKQLALINDRRNKIAHESDRDYLSSGKNPIDKPLVDGTIEFLDKFCESIAKLL